MDPLLITCPRCGAGPHNPCRSSATIKGVAKEKKQPHVARIEAAHPTVTWWSAGWSMPGYLPEMEPGEFSDWQDAAHFIESSISMFWDEDQDAIDPNETPVPPMRNDSANDPITLCCGRDVADCDCSIADFKWLEIHTRIHSAIRDQDWSCANGDNSLVFWIQRVHNQVAI